MAPKSDRRCCTWPRCSVFVLVLGGIIALVYFLTPLGDEVENLINDGQGNSTSDDNDTGNEPGSSTAPPTQAPTLTPYQFFQCDEVNLDGCCNGLDGLCDLRIDEVLWPMSHNAMATLQDGFLLFPNHLYPLEESLDAGYRGLDLEVCLCGGTYTLCHGQCNLGTRDPITVFTNIVSFLDNNPTESLLINLELNSDADGQIVLGDFASLMLEGVPRLRGFLHIQEDTTQLWPTFGELIASSTRLVLFHHRGPTCRVIGDCPEGFHYWFDSAVETPFSFSNENELLDSATSCTIDRGGDGTRSFFAVNTFTTLPDITEARIVNQRTFLEGRVEACSRLNGDADVNVVHVDFWHEGAVLETIQEHNRLLIQSRRQLSASRDLQPYQFFQCGNNLDNCCNGLDGLCDLRIDDILWPMSHNAMSTKRDGFAFPNHNKPLERSMKEGIRGINLDVCNCGGEYTFCSGFCNLGRRDPVKVFKKIVRFLKDNPTESIIVNLELDSGANLDVVLDDFAELILGGVRSLRKNLYVQEDIAQPWPTLRTLKDSNKRLVLFHQGGPTCRTDGECPEGFHYWFDSVVETPFEFWTINQLQNTASSCSFDRGSDGNLNFFAVNTFMQLPNRRVARAVNGQDFLESHMMACSSLNFGALVNFLIVDFWHFGNVLETIQDDNRQRIQRRRQLMDGEFRTVRRQ